MFKNHLLFIFLFVLSLATSSLRAANYFSLKHIVLENRKHQTIKEDKKLHKILQKYTNKNLTLKDLQSLQKELQNYYKSIGYEYTKIIIPPQTIKQGTLHLIVYKPIVGKIVVEGNKYYSTKFILERFRAKENDYLKYNDMIESLLMINDYPDINTKIFLQNNKDTNKTDVILKVKDERPFHAFLQFDNLGSKTISKNRANINISYGNLLRDGDTFQFYTTYALKHDKHNQLYMTNYSVPINTYNTKLNLGYLTSTYLVGGEFQDLGIKGDTKNYNIGLSQPIFKTFKQSLNFSLRYTKKRMKNYILDTQTSKEVINDYDSVFDYSINSLYASNKIQFGILFGKIEDEALKSRTEGSDKFIKYHCKISRNQFINKTNSIVFKVEGQYSNYRLPTTEMYSIGGSNTVKGFDSSTGMGDSGYSTSLEWLNQLFQFKSLICQAGVFINYGEVYKTNPITSEYKDGALLGYGVDTKFSMSNRYFLDLSLGYPIDSKNIDYQRKAQIYATLNIKLW